MQNDMFILAERLVVAMERMSDDVKNISAYIYDLSHSVSCILNENREKEDISQVPCDEEANRPSGSPAAGQKSYAKRECSSPYEQFNEGIKSEKLSGSEENDESSSMCNTFESGNSNIQDVAENVKHGIGPSDAMQEESDVHFLTSEDKGSSKEVNQRPHFKCSVAHGRPQIASSLSQFLSVEAIGTRTQDLFSKNAYSSEKSPVFSQHRQGHEPFLIASCSTANGITGQERAADRYLAEGHQDVQIAGVSDPLDQSDREKDARSTITSPQIEIQKHSSLMISPKGSKSVGGSGVFECSVCRKPFASKCTLACHMKVHTNERPFMCSVCGKYFKRKEHLRVHVRVHTGERPFKCIQCGNAFRQRSVFLRHVLVHSNEKLFRCSQCGAGFKQEYELLMHMSVHVGD